ncbi:MAG: IPTL-CTERM sorting domain-containing protein [Thermodesulfobacteriota bacterium]
MEFFINEICSEGSLTCPSFVLADSDLRNVPTLSQLGLLAMAGLLGIVGFIVVRRRKLHVGA